MSRIRTTKPDFWSDESVVECSRDARLLFIGMWNFCDDDGRIEDSPKQIRMRVLPGDEDITSAMVDGWLQQLADKDLICRYRVGDKRVIQVLGWADHQKISHPKPGKLLSIEHRTDNSVNPPEVSVKDPEPTGGKQEPSAVIGFDLKGTDSVPSELALGAPEPPQVDPRLVARERVWGPLLDDLAAMTGKSRNTLKPLVGKWCAGNRELQAMTTIDAALRHDPPLVEPSSWINARMEQVGYGRNREVRSADGDRAGIVEDLQRTRGMGASHAASGDGDTRAA